MDSYLAHYAIRHYSQLMTAHERLAHRHLTGAIKATHGRSDTAAQAEAKANKALSKLLSDDPVVLQLAGGGWGLFVERTAQRILTENGERVFLNFCPRCAALARTPTARQCRFCGHDWHATPMPEPLR